MAGGPYADHFQLPCLNVSDDRHMEYARTKLIVPTVCIDRFSWRGSQTNADGPPGITNVAPKPLRSLLYISPERIPGFRVMSLRWVHRGKYSGRKKISNTSGDDASQVRPVNFGSAGRGCPRREGVQSKITSR
jgi:hypothetical protein